jgi:hypothetical protein
LNCLYFWIIVTPSKSPGQGSYSPSKKAHINRELSIILLGDPAKKKKSKVQEAKRDLSIAEKKTDDKMRDLLLNNVEVTDFSSIYDKSLLLKETLKPQSLLNYKKHSETTKTTKKMLFELQNKNSQKGAEMISKEKRELIRTRMKRLKYLYRKKTKGVNINLHNVNQRNPENPTEGMFIRIQQYEHYIKKKIGFTSQRRDLLHQTMNWDPTKRFLSLKTSNQLEEEEELKNLIEYFEKQVDENENHLSSKVSIPLFTLSRSTKYWEIGTKV